MQLGYLIGMFVHGRDKYAEFDDELIDQKKRRYIMSGDTPTLITDYAVATGMLIYANNAPKHDIFGFGDDPVGNFKIYALEVKTFQLDNLPNQIYDQHVFDMLKGKRY